MRHTDINTINSDVSKNIESVIVCGNGPSLGKIDYRRFPTKEVEIFRVNDFFLEEVCYVGTQVDAIFNGGESYDTLNRYYKFCCLNDEHIYNINFSNIFSDRDFPKEIANLCGFNAAHFIRNYVREVMCLIDKRNLPFSRILWYSHTFLHCSPFSGVWAILYAVFKGYKNIYLAGIDNRYDGAKDYAWQLISQLSAKQRLEVHPEYFQRNIIEHLLSIGAKLFSLSLESPVNDIVPLAPLLTDTPTYIPIPKEKISFPPPHKVFCQEDFTEMGNSREKPLAPLLTYIPDKYYLRLIRLISNFLLKKDARHAFFEKHKRKKQCI